MKLRGFPSHNCHFDKTPRIFIGDVLHHSRLELKSHFLNSEYFQLLHSPFELLCVIAGWII